MFYFDNRLSLFVFSFTLFLIPQTEVFSAQSNPARDYPVEHAAKDSVGIDWANTLFHIDDQAVGWVTSFHPTGKN